MGSLGRIVCEVAGWEYCEEHDRRRYGPDSCADEHDDEPRHVYYCQYPDQPCPDACWWPE